MTLTLDPLSSPTESDTRPAPEPATQARKRDFARSAPPRDDVVRPATRSLIALATASALVFGGAVVAGFDDVATPVERPVVNLSDVADQIGARAAWSQGITGDGAVVAVVDTGVAPVDELADQIIATVDTSGERFDPSLSTGDGFGHGTHMAGIVAGREASADLVSGTGFAGIAPDADIVSIKVADRTGAVSASALLDGIDFAVAHRDELGIGVLLIAIDSDTGVPYGSDPVAAALERAWAAGITVVTAAGNDGAASDGLNSPSHDPFVISVGGLESAFGDFEVPSWASRGDAVRRPDLAAPGAHIASLRSPGSDADVNHPEGYVDEQTFLGSGSSQSAAVVAAVAALLHSADPTLTPDEIKAALVRSARPLDASPDFVGAGVVDVMGALKADVSDAAQTWPRSTGSSVVAPLSAGFTAADLWTGNTWTGNTWTGNTWTGNTWTGNTWTGNTWTGNTWTGNTWTGNTWTGNTWTGNTWTGNTWTGNTWTGNTWTGNTWTGNTWTGNTWTGNTWTGNTWTGNTWTGNTWTGNTWTGNTWTGNTWTGNTWTGNTWTGNTWTGNTWTGNTWTGNTWTGNTWTGNTWTGNTWTGNTWTGNTWTGNTWTGNTWTGNTWTGNTWTGNTWTGNTWT